MARTVGIGIQSFEDIRKNNCFYVDKTRFIKEWWENRDSVTLLTRPRRFGKTLTMNMVEQFFSLKYADRGDLFEGLAIWEEEEYRKLQGTYPVIFLSFAEIKETDYANVRRRMNQLLTGLYARHYYLMDSDALPPADKRFFDSVREDLLKGKTLHTEIDEQIVFDQLDYAESAIWSLLLASGYLRVEKYAFIEEWGREEYDLVLTNKEVRMMFERIIKGWFAGDRVQYNEFVNALLQDNKKEMNIYMNKITLETFSFFDTGNRPSEYVEPERFYHGFVLGLLVGLRERYLLTSNRESGYGRYDVMLEPKHQEDPGILLEFKVYDHDEEESLEDTVRSALRQIEEKQYATSLEAKGIEPERIRKYGFAFEGKKVLIG